MYGDCLEDKTHDYHRLCTTEIHDGMHRLLLVYVLLLFLCDLHIFLDAGTQGQVVCTVCLFVYFEYFSWVSLVVITCADSYLERLVSKMTCYALSEMLVSTHSL